MRAGFSLGIATVVLAAIGFAYADSTNVEPYIVTGWTTAGLSTSRDVPHDIAFHLLVTSGRTVVILAFGSICAVVLAAIVRQTRSRVSLDILVLLSAIPPLVWVPLSLAAFGLRGWAFDLPAVLFVGALLAPSILGHARTAPVAPMDFLTALEVPATSIRRKVVAPWVLRALAPQVTLTLGLIFGVCAVVEYLSNFNGVGRVLSVITYYAEVTDIIALTVASTAAVLVLQAFVRFALARLVDLL